ncbi:MAG: hypothetical protein EXX96DRAFT_526746 [Benjaminiella poitrasii]|nr:MAG: hypothetical protein EXX96DRAFT_526746 [Benjaminiella poitrasii]
MLPSLENHNYGVLIIVLCSRLYSLKRKKKTYYYDGQIKQLKNIHQKCQMQLLVQCTTVRICAWDMVNASLEVRPNEM